MVDSYINFCQDKIFKRITDSLILYLKKYKAFFQISNFINCFYNDISITKTSMNSLSALTANKT